MRANKALLVALTLPAIALFTSAEAGSRSLGYEPIETSKLMDAYGFAFSDIFSAREREAAAERIVGHKYLFAVGFTGGIFGGVSDLNKFTYIGADLPGTFGGTFGRHLSLNVKHASRFKNEMKLRCTFWEHCVFLVATTITNENGEGAAFRVDKFQFIEQQGMLGIVFLKSLKAAVKSVALGEGVKPLFDAD